MKYFTTALACFTLIAFSMQSSAEGTIPSVLSACRAVSAVEEEQNCRETVAEYIGTDRAAARRAEQALRQLSWAASGDRVDGDAVVIALEVVQRSTLPKVAKQRAFAVALQFGGLDAQVSPSFDAVPEALLAALGVEMDGFSLEAGPDAAYTIVSTFASTEKLCRVVSLETRLTFATKSFCKVKGGEWR